MTQEEFNAMLAVGIAQGLPGSYYTSKFSNGEEIDRLLSSVDDKAPAGLVESVIRCFTNDDIEAAINTCYSTMADNTIRNIILTISVAGLDLPGGNNFLTVCRRNVNFGMILSYTYSKHFIASRAYLNATWQEWRYVMFTDERYGLGDVIGPSCSDFHTLKYNGWYYINNADHSPVFGGTEYRWGVALVIAARTNIQIEYWTPQTFANQHFRILWNANTGWGPWEAINPNMEVGTEYRTIERYNRKPVYVKLINCGALPNNGTKQVAIGAENIDQILRCDASFSGGFLIPFLNKDTGGRVEVSRADRSGIYLTTNYDFSGYSAHVAVEYTKTT